MVHQAYIEMLQPARIKEREKVTQRLVKKKYQKEKETSKKTLAIEYKIKDEKRGNLDNTQNRKTKKDLDRNFNESDKDLANILIDLEPSIEVLSNVGIQFDMQVTNKVSNTDLSNQQEFEQTPEIRDSFTEAKSLKGNFCSKSVFSWFLLKQR